MRNWFIRKAPLLLAFVALGYGGALVVDSGIASRFSAGTLIAAHAQGHSSGGSKGGSSKESGGHDSGGHDSGGSSEVKGFGTKGKHEGHSSGQHGGASSSHNSGGERFGGGSGLRGNDQVPEGVGRFGEGAASVTSDQGRQRYWGGWILPEAPAPAPLLVTPAVTDVVIGSGGGPSMSSRDALDGPTRCEGVVSGMAPSRQFAGANLLRLNAARGEVDPVLAASGKIASPFLMGNLQDELTKAQPNAELAGIYLGLVAKAKITPVQVKKIGTHLCAVISDSQAENIADIAESQRNTLIAAENSPRP